MSQNQLEKMVNIGQTIAGRLREIGVRTPDDLRKQGSIKTYLKLQSVTSDRLPICYNLLSLEGAIRGLDWRELPEDLKYSLLNEVKDFS